MKQKLGMTNFQIGILFFLGILTCTIVGGIGFLIFNKTTGNENFNLTFSNPQNKIIGKWEVISENNKGAIYEFFPDGTLKAGEFVVSEYSFPDRTHIKIETGKLEAVLEYTLSNNELTLTNNSYILKLRKIK